jgi:RNA polymerase sigma-70 factor (ECF subfamily)
MTAAGTAGGGPGEVRRTIAAAAVTQIAAVATNRDKDAYAALFSHYAPRVKAYLQLTGLPGEAAEDLAQETMFLVWRGAECFDVNCSAAETWVYQIARNLLREEMRRDKRAHGAGLSGVKTGMPTDEAAETIASRQDRVVIDLVLGSLEPTLSEPVRLAYFNSLNQPTDEPRATAAPGTVSSRLRVAVDRLRRHVREPSRSVVGKTPSAHLR